MQTFLQEPLLPDTDPPLEGDWQVSRNGNLWTICRGRLVVVFRYTKGRRAGRYNYVIDRTLFGGHPFLYQREAAEAALHRLASHLIS